MRETWKLTLLLRTLPIIRHGRPRSLVDDRRWLRVDQGLPPEPVEIAVGLKRRRSPPSLEVGLGRLDRAREQRRQEALGLGGAKLKAVLNDIKNGLDEDGTSSGPATGGEVLTILHNRLQRMSGDPSALALYRALMRAAGRPYAEMLVAWMRNGKLDDPYEELCVKENKFITKGNLEVDYTDEYWERRYTVGQKQQLNCTCSLKFV